MKGGTDVVLTPHHRLEKGAVVWDLLSKFGPGGVISCSPETARFAGVAMARFWRLTSEPIFSITGNPEGQYRKPLEGKGLSSGPLCGPKSRADDPGCFYGGSGAACVPEGTTRSGGAYS